MADLDVTTGLTGVVPHNSGALRVVKVQVDLDAIGAATTDVVKVLPVAAGTFVAKVLCRIVRAAAGTAATATIGDGDNADGFETEVDLKGAADTVTSDGLGLTEGTPNTLVDAYAGGKYYAAADTLDLTLTYDTVTDGGKVELIVLMAEAVEL